MNVFYGAINAVIIILTGIVVYRKDSESVVNRGFAYSTIFASIGFATVMLSSLIWTTPILFEPGVVTLNRVSYYSILLTALLVCWSSRVLYDGQAVWNRRRNFLFFGIIATINFVAVLTPDASYIIQDIPERHAGQGALFSLIFYPSVAFLAVGTFLTFLMTYRMARDDDRIIARQAGRLSLASLFIIIGMVLALLVGRQLVQGDIRYISYTIITLGVIIMASGFTQESSLLKVKIMSELKRLSRSLTKGKTNTTEEQIKYLSTLVEREGAESSIAKLNILDSLLAISKLNLRNARITLESAKALAVQHDLDKQRSEIHALLMHIEQYERENYQPSSGELMRDEDYRGDDILKALAYLDEIIRQRMKEEDNLGVTMSSV